MCVSMACSPVLSGAVISLGKCFQACVCLPGYYCCSGFLFLRQDPDTDLTWYDFPALVLGVLGLQAEAMCPPEYVFIVYEIMQPWVELIGGLRTCLPTQNIACPSMWVMSPCAAENEFEKRSLRSLCLSCFCTWPGNTRLSSYIHIHTYSFLV